MVIIPLKYFGTFKQVEWNPFLRVEIYTFPVHTSDCSVTIQLVGMIGPRGESTLWEFQRMGMVHLEQVLMWNLAGTGEMAAGIAADAVDAFHQFQTVCGLRWMKQDLCQWFYMFIGGVYYIEIISEECLKRKWLGQYKDLWGVSKWGMGSNMYQGTVWFTEVTWYYYCLCNISWAPHSLLLITKHLDVVEHVLTEHTLLSQVPLFMTYCWMNFCAVILMVCYCSCNSDCDSHSIGPWCEFLWGDWECSVVLVIMLLKIFVFPRMELAFNMYEMF